MADVNLFFDPIRTEDSGFQFVSSDFVGAGGEAPPPSIVKKLYIGGVQATNVIYVDGTGTQKTNIQIYSGSTKVWG